MKHFARSALAATPLMAALIVFLTVSHSFAASGLWVPNGPDIAVFQGGLGKGTKAAHRTISGPDINVAGGIAFDKNGNLWSSNFAGETITMFSAAQIHNLKKVPQPAATRTIGDDGSGDLAKPEGLVFDSSGNLWVGAEHLGLVLEYTAAQIAGSGNPTPNIVLNGNSFIFDSPSDPIFDGSGNLWIIDESVVNGNGGNGEIFRYDAGQVSALTAGIRHVDPAFGLGASIFGHIEGAAFDASGNMWVADEDNDELYKFSAAQLSGSGLGNNLSPVVTLDSSSVKNKACTKTLDGPYGVAIDASGNLYVDNNASTGPSCVGSLVEFPAKSIALSGSPAPKGFVGSNAAGTNINFPGYMLFGPAVP